MFWLYNLPCCHGELTNISTLYLKLWCIQVQSHECQCVFSSLCNEHVFLLAVLQWHEGELFTCHPPLLHACAQFRGKCTFNWAASIQQSHQLCKLVLTNYDDLMNWLISFQVMKLLSWTSLVSPIKKFTDKKTEGKLKFKVKHWRVIWLDWSVLTDTTFFKRRFFLFFTVCVLFASLSYEMTDLALT